MSNEEVVVFTLVDFKANNLLNNHQNNQLMELLKETLRKPSNKAFSCKFEPCGPIYKFGEEWTHGGFIEISYRYKCLIAFAKSQVFIFDQNSRVLINTFELHDAIAAVVDDESNHIYIVGTGMNDCDFYVKKFDLGLFIQSKKQPNVALLWDTCPASIQGPFGVTIFKGESKKYLIVADSNSADLVILNCLNGDELSGFTLSLQTSANSITMRTRNEMVVGGAQHIEIYNIDDSISGIPRLTFLNYVTKVTGFFYSITFCPAGQYIITDTERDTISVIDRNTLEVVKCYKDEILADNLYGMCYDNINGILYCCCRSGFYHFK